MAASLSEWIVRLGAKPLPAMASTVSLVTRLIDSPVATHGEFERILARDPGFAIGIFRQLSSLSPPPKSHINTLGHALALLGIGSLDSQTREIPRLQEPATGRRDTGIHLCLSRACHAAAYARHWGGMRQDPNPKELGLASLVRECGEMALWTHSREHMEKIQNHVQKGMNRENAALAVLGFTLDQLSHALAEQWQLPLLAVESLLPVGAFKPRPLGIMLASALARSSSSAWTSIETRELLDLAAGYLRMTIDQVTASVHSQTAEVARELYGLPLHTAAYRLLLEPPAESTGGSDSGRKRVDLSPSVAAHPISSAGSTPAADPSGGEGAASSPHLSDPQEVPPKSAIGSQTGDLQSKLNRAALYIRQQTGMQRTLFAVLSPDRKTLRARFVAGAPADSPIGRFELSLEQRNLFSLLLTKPHGFWLNSANREQFLPVIPAAVRSTLNLDGFFASSLFIRGMPLGLLYADRSDPWLTSDEDFQRFKDCARRLSGDIEAKVA